MNTITPKTGNSSNSSPANLFPSHSPTEDDEASSAEDQSISRHPALEITESIVDASAATIYEHDLDKKCVLFATQKTAEFIRSYVDFFFVSHDPGEAESYYGDWQCEEEPIAPPGDGWAPGSVPIGRKRPDGRTQRKQREGNALRATGETTTAEKPIAIAIAIARTSDQRPVPNSSLSDRREGRDEFRDPAIGEKIDTASTISRNGDRSDNRSKGIWKHNAGVVNQNSNSGAKTSTPTPKKKARRP